LEISGNRYDFGSLNRWEDVKIDLRETYEGAVV
jgi:hypothetical protein